MLKRLAKKSGFTLVECLIAVVVFALMALIVLTIISASIKTQEDNNQKTRNLLTQKEEIANNQTLDGANGQIIVNFGAPADGGSTTFNVKRVVSNTAGDPSEDNVLEITEFKVP